MMMMLSFTTLSSCMLEPFDWIFYIGLENREFRKTGVSFSETGISFHSPAHLFPYSITTTIKYNYSEYDDSVLPQVFHKQVTLPYYYEGPCDANVLASCVSDASSNNVIFMDLDPVSFESFTTFSSSGNNNTGSQSRLVLFYEPSRFMDKLFFVQNAPYTVRMTTTSNNMTWLSNNNKTQSAIEPVIGRVNCAKYPNLCHDKTGSGQAVRTCTSFFSSSLSTAEPDGVPQLVRFFPSDENRAEISKTFFPV